MDRDFLKELEATATRVLAEWMTPFNENGQRVIACPNLRFSITTRGRPEAILIMQDWGSSSDASEDELSDSVAGSKTLDECFRQKRRDRSDRTLKNLLDAPFRPGGLLNKEAILSGRLYLMNAVWGCRKHGNKCGPLKKRIHEAAFPIWSAVLNHLADANPRFRVLLAGAWASRFLDRDFQSLAVVRCNHPCLWKMTGYPDF